MLCSRLPWHFGISVKSRVISHPLTHSFTLPPFAATSPENQVRIFQYNGIVPLVKLLSHMSERVVEQAAAALANCGSASAISVHFLFHLLSLPPTAANSTNQNLIRDVDGIPPLVAVLAIPNSKIQRQAAMALKYLAGNELNRELIRQADAIPQLIEVLRESEPRAQAMAAGALGFLGQCFSLYFCVLHCQTHTWCVPVIYSVR